ncbi:electron transfer flavoprotein subunit beta/FixA family protein [Salinibacterium sp. ZJ70]|uniref:electron transfer flavoprotein subunit beta/FixA family protein n=1 Tax=Salinibacterium sp. ZJ70 TaxID=2708084 RepID=UPI00141EE5A7|nr:electron transfer flavoprotein subunit beta/FixA family protein [Salinibacterium sp. ZJ70]
MKILVFTKEVPDTYGTRALDLHTGLVDRAGGDRVLDEIGERALEAALALRDAGREVEIVVVTMGPDEVAASVRKALAMGADRAIHVSDQELVGADLATTAQVLAAVARRENPDLAIFGNVSTDGAGGVIPVMVAEHLGVGALTALTTLNLDGAEVRGLRVADGAAADVRAALPAVVSITEAFPEARFPNFKGIMAAKKKPYEQFALADLDLAVRIDEPRTILVAVAQKPARTQGTIVVDAGDGGEQLAQFLLSKKLV